ncbi:MAG TPA: hemolysin family protein, partial [Gemmatimonadaceae bacterium]|nr:hemolysin family protein [Gemmatimonadaceae bacterium]
GRRTSVDRSVTEQDVRALLEQGAEAGAVDLVEHTIMENTFRLGDRRVSTVMTPRMDVRWVDIAAGADELRSRLAEARWSPYVVCNGDIENVVGLVYAEDILEMCLAGQPLDLGAVLREPLFVPLGTPVLRMLETFRTTRRHAAVVLDEFGGVAGVATVDDIVQGLIGALPEPDDSTPPAIARQPDGSWLIDGSAPVADVDEVLDLDLPRGTEAREFDTVGGLVMMVLGRLPRTGDSVDYAGARFIVEHMDGRRVAEVRARLAGER